MPNIATVRWVRIASLLMLSLGVLVAGAPAGAQEPGAEECGTYGPACDTSSGTGGDSTPTGDTGGSPGGDSATAGVGPGGDSATAGVGPGGDSATAGVGPGDDSATAGGPDGRTTGGPASGTSGDTRNCTQIKAETGRVNIPKGDPLYRPRLDRYGDGIACEEKASGGSSGGGLNIGGASAASPGTPGQASTTGELGRTGSSASTVAIVAAAAVLFGSALVLGVRRRKRLTSV